MLSTALGRLTDATPTDDPLPQQSETEAGFSNLTGSEAEDLLQATFPDQSEAPGGELLGLPEGGEVVRYHGDYAARIHVDGVGDVVALSVLPLRAPDESGAPAPVDLTLEREGESFVPANPLVDLSLPVELRDGIVVGDDHLVVAPATASADAAVASRVEGSLFYPEVATDTDWLVAPVPTGVETFAQLRSAESPERHVLDFGLPANANIRLTGDGGADVVRGEDRLAAVLPPTAIDSSGQQVPVNYETDGESLTVVASHQAGGFTYPILVDPVIEDWGTQGGWHGNPLLDQAGWEATDSPLGEFRFAREGNEIASYGAPPGRGLYVQAPPKSQSAYEPGDFGLWHWRAPGQTTFISRADFRSVFFDRRGASPNKPVVLAGIWNSGQGAFAGYHLFAGPLANFNDSVVPGDNVTGAAPQRGDTATFELLMPEGKESPKWVTAYLGGAIIYLDDPEPAEITNVTGADDWLGSGTQTLNVEARDPGIGVRVIELESPLGTETRTHDCLGDRTSRCPAEWAQPFEIDTDLLPEGVSDLAASAIDALGQRSQPHAFQVQVDRSNPELHLSGSLHEAAGHYVGDEGLALHVRATDGSDTAMRSGVRRLELLVDGESRGVHVQDCPAGGCALEADFNVDSLSDGAHTVEVGALDGAGNEVQRDWEVRVDRVAPTLDASGPLWERFGSKPNGLLETFTTPTGNSSHFEYDAGGRMTLDRDAGTGSKTLTQSTSDSTSSVTIESAQGRQRTYDVERSADGTVRRGFTGADGLSFDSVERPDGTRTVARPDGESASAETSPDPRFGLATPIASRSTVTTPGGRTVDVTEARQVQLTDSSNPLSLARQTDTRTINGRAYTTVFDAPLRRYTDAAPSGRTLVTDVDAQQRIIRSETAGLAPTEFSYDPQGRLTSVARGERALTYSYDQRGRVETRTDVLDRVTSYEYDAADRLVRTTLPDGREVGYSYDSGGNLVGITPPSRPSHVFGYTVRDEADAYTPPDVGAGAEPTRFGYSPDGELTSLTRPGGRQVTFGYDSAGRPETISQPRGETRFSYDAQTGDLRTLTAPGGQTTTLAFDGSLVTRATSTGPVAGDVAWTYDNNLRLASQSVNGGQSVGYTYDSDGLLTAAGAVSLTRSAQNGSITALGVGSTATTVTRNPFGEPETSATKIGDELLYEETYARDPLGRITQKTERRGGDTVGLGYTYDDAGRLATVTRNGAPSASYRYDANGNRTEVRRDGALVSTADYDDQDRLQRHGDATYSYTAAGDLETKTEGAQTTRYEYDELGSLTGVTLPNDARITYVVDAAGRRVAKRRDGELEQAFLYGSAPAPIAELRADGTIKSRFVYATRAHVPEYMVRDGVTYRIVTDHLSSPRLVVNSATGAIAQELDFDEFGRVIRDTNPGFQPFGYAGGLHDQDTGLVHFGARDYDAEAGRWTAKDPIGFAGGDSNLYGYVLGNPINFVDPEGLWPGFVDDAVGWGADRVSDAYGTAQRTVAEIPDAISSGRSAEFLGNEIIGFTNTVTVGGSNALLGIDSDCVGPGYGFGSVLGLGAGVGGVQAGIRAAPGAVRSVAAAGERYAATPRGRHLFGRSYSESAFRRPDGKNGLLNDNNFVRVGMGFSKPHGRELFRMGFGPPKTRWHGHFDFFQ